MKIENGERLIIIKENMLRFYDEETETLEGAPITWENGELIDIDSDYLAITKEKGFKLYILDGLGNIEQTYL